MVNTEDSLIKAEHNFFIKGKPKSVGCMIMDNHYEHVRQHSNLLSLFSIDQTLFEAISIHIDEHIQYLSPKQKKIIEWNKGIKDLINE